MDRDIPRLAKGKAGKGAMDSPISFRAWRKLRVEAKTKAATLELHGFFNVVAATALIVFMLLGVTLLVMFDPVN